MANILLSTMWTGGDVFPFVEIGQALKSKGHRVTLITHGYYEEMVKSLGLNFAATDTIEDFKQFTLDNNLFNTPKEFILVYRKYVLPTILKEYQIIKDLCSAEDTILISRAMPAIAPRLAAENLGIPLMLVYMSPYHLASMPLADELFKGFASEINFIRTSIGLSEIYDWSLWLQKPFLSIGLWADWFGDKKYDWPVETQCVGFVGSTQWASEEVFQDEEIQKVIKSRAPILITGGTSPLGLGEKFFSLIAEACAILDSQAILVCNNQQVVPNNLPPNVKWYKHFPSLMNIMPHMKAIIHHGGMGTISQALTAGLPQLVLAFGADRPGNGIQLQKLGVGEFLPPPKWQPNLIAKALEQLLNSKDVKGKCQKFAQEIKSADSLGIISEIIEKVLLKGSFQKQALVEEVSVLQRTPEEVEEIASLDDSTIENTILEMFVNVLGVQNIGVNDNFFALGGDSLRMTQIILGIQEKFQVEIPRAVLFEMATVSSLANVVLQELVDSSKDGLETLKEIENMSEEEVRKLLE